MIHSALDRKGDNRVNIEITFVYFSITTYIVTPHLTVCFLYFIHTLNMIHIATDRKGDNRVN